MIMCCMVDCAKSLSIDRHVASLSGTKTMIIIVFKHRISKWFLRRCGKRLFQRELCDMFRFSLKYANPVFLLRLRLRHQSEGGLCCHFEIDFPKIIYVLSMECHRPINKLDSDILWEPWMWACAAKWPLVDGFIFTNTSQLIKFRLNFVHKWRGHKTHFTFRTDPFKWTLLNASG